MPLASTSTDCVRLPQPPDILDVHLPGTPIKVNTTTPEILPPTSSEQMEGHDSLIAGVYCGKNLSASTILRPLRPDEVNETQYNTDATALQEKVDRSHALETEVQDEEQHDQVRERLRQRFENTESSGRTKGKEKRHDEKIVPDGQCPCRCERTSTHGYRQCNCHVERARESLHYPTTEKWQEELKWLRTLSKNRDKVFLIDTEFAIFLDLCAVAWEISIRNLSEILRCPVDYNGATVDELLEQYKNLSPPGHSVSVPTESRIRTSFARIYRSGRAWGTTFSQMRNALIRRGFDPSTHAVLSYASTLDLQVFWNVMNGIDTPLTVYTAKKILQLTKMQRSCFQPVNVHWLLKEMLAYNDYSLQAVVKK
ncbi:hypothetical protein N0V94_005593 [Neodidymelliopsis sp. IMI 364377]|nr:hypothetical protein N0V94_005593 [Neodidymelliopsis sp. IMI 364377]